MYNKISVNYRLDETVCKMLLELSSKTGYSKTQLIEMFVVFGYSKFFDTLPSRSNKDFTGIDFLKSLDAERYIAITQVDN